jgi:hypothetical protein
VSLSQVSVTVVNLSLKIENEKTPGINNSLILNHMSFSGDMMKSPLPHPSPPGK